ncbi:MAG: hypothetical protein ACXACI_12510 [Candidatus Hodarchaeales archaeon]
MPEIPQSCSLGVTPILLPVFPISNRLVDGFNYARIIDGLRQQYGDGSIAGEYLSYHHFLQACRARGSEHSSWRLLLSISGKWA